MSRIKASLLVLALAAGLLAVGSPPPAEAASVGRYAVMFDYSFPSAGAVYVFPKKAGYLLYAYNYICQVDGQKLPLTALSMNAKLKKASLYADTPCGPVSMSWQGSGDLSPGVGVGFSLSRYGTASGYVGSRFLATANDPNTSGAYFGIQAGP